MAELEHWRPINRSLPNEAESIIEATPLPVHLFLVGINNETKTRTACGAGLGEWITGKGIEVTCVACKPWVHS